MTIQEFKNSTSLPVIVSPMFLVSGTELVIECCKNGIVGCFPSLNGRKEEDFENMLIEVTQRLKKFEKETGRKPAPFGVNIIVNRTNPRVETDLRLCVKYKVPLVITSLGAVKELVQAVHSYGGLVFHDVIKKRHAEKAAEVGVDGIIAVSAGAGGHAGLASPFALVKEIKKFYNGIVVLAGAMNTGGDIAAAECLGADFAYMGTHFIATTESMASEAYKNMLVKAEVNDIIYTDAVSGVHGNFLKESIVNAGVDLTTKKEEDFSKLSNEHAKAWKDIWSAGQGTTMIQSVESVQKVVEVLKKEYVATLQKQAAKFKALNE